jgi:FixJ family two-component response regulator
VVEDDEHISQVLRFMLERQGYQVQPNELLARVRRHLPVGA